MKNKVYLLKLELKDRHGHSVRNEEGLRLAGAADGIIRELLVRGDRNLLDLHLAIQKVFGWRNKHLHRFSLTEKDFSRVTLGRPDIYLAFSGVLFRHFRNVCAEWHWHKLFKEVSEESTAAGIKARQMLMRNTVCGDPLQVNAVSESFFYNRIKLPGTFLGPEGAGYCHMEADRPKFDTPEEMYGHNVLLDRLKIAEVLSADSRLSIDGASGAEWRTRMLSSAAIKIRELADMVSGSGKEYHNLRSCAEEYEKRFNEYLRIAAALNEKEKGRGQPDFYKENSAADEAFMEEVKLGLVYLNMSDGKLLQGLNPEIHPGLNALSMPMTAGTAGKSR